MCVYMHCLYAWPFFNVHKIEQTELFDDRRHRRHHHYHVSLDSIEFNNVHIKSVDSIGLSFSFALSAQCWLLGDF